MSQPSDPKRRTKSSNHHKSQEGTTRRKLTSYEMLMSPALKAPTTPLSRIPTLPLPNINIPSILKVGKPLPSTPSGFSVGMSARKLVRFLGDAGVLEKLLRLLQGVCQVLAAWYFSISYTEFNFWIKCRGQFALGRRFFRFFKWMDCFLKAFDVLANGKVGVGNLALVGKWTFMGMYLGAESLTFLDITQIYPVPWAKACMLHGNKFWFYSFICSIISALITIYFGPGNFSSSQRLGVKNEVKAEKEKLFEMEKQKEIWRRKRWGVWRGLVGDCVSLVIPGNFIGWIPCSLGVVGGAGLFSTSLQLYDAWVSF